MLFPDIHNILYLYALSLACFLWYDCGKAMSPYAKSVFSMKDALFSLPELGFQPAELAPMMSEQTIKFHYGKHFRTYVDTLNTLVKGSDFEGLSLEDIVRKAPEGKLLNNAGQALNHQLFFEQLIPAEHAKQPSGELQFLIEQSFGSFDAFRDQMTQAALSLFGSGWVWLASNADGVLQILSLPNADNPLRHGLRPILTFDMWEHAYYLDYQNNRMEYIKNLWLLINWHVVSQRLG